MPRNIIVEKSHRPPVEKLNIEIVERKGIGHPDTLADGISEAVSEALSKEYLNRFGSVLHHNTDKVLIVGGSAKPKFRGGDLEKPIHVVVAGRGTARVDDERVPVNEIAKKTCEKYLDETIRFLETEKHVEIDSRIGSGSVDLKNVFEREGMPSSNDTSMGTGYAPLSETEELVFKTERDLNSHKFKKKFPAIGEDIKVMGQREDNHINLTVAAAAVSSQLDDEDHYFSLKGEVSDYIRGLANEITEKHVEVHLNTADDPNDGTIYQTVTGTSAEMGDDGMTGRGNRTNGLITFERPMSLEAAAGKNPVNHVGKIYNLLSMEIAEEIANGGGVKEVLVKTLSQIGKPIDKPKVLNIQLLPEKEESLKRLREKSEKIAEEHLEKIQDLSRRIIEGGIQVY